ncbi:MAG TPA: sialidase family protein, partial [Acidimicrobiales bacterium]|nr:sialidase family protein [Acidimicrobiales bacterium]
MTAMNQETSPANNSPALAADPTDGRFVVLANRLDAPDFGCELSVSGDGGASWEPASGAPALPDGAEKCYAPEIDFDGEGTLYVLFVGLAGPGNRPMGAFMSTSTDRAKTFSPPRPVLGPLNFAVRMAIDRSLGEMGRIHVAWIHAT